jgi:hypothetical protein
MFVPARRLRPTADSACIHACMRADRWAAGARSWKEGLNTDSGQLGASAAARSAPNLWHAPPKRQAGACRGLPARHGAAA